MEIRKPKSTLALVALMNFVVAKGYTKPNNNLYEAMVRDFNEKGQQITGHILADGTFVAGKDIPEELASIEVKATYLYELPIKANLHINGLGKNAYKTDLAAARCYKLSLPELFSLTDADYDSVITKTKEPFDAAPNPLPALPDDIEATITHFARLTPSIENSVPAKSVSGSGGSVKASSKIDPDVLTAKIIATEESRRTRVQYTVAEQAEIKSELLTAIDVKDQINGNLKAIDTVEFRTNTEVGEGFLPMSYVNGDMSTKFQLKTNILEKTVRIVLSNTLGAQDIQNLTNIIDNFDNLGVSIHEVNENKKKYNHPLVYDNSTYKVYA